MFNHPIQAVTEKFQFRAIGLVKGTYIPNSDNYLNKGKIIDSNSNEIDSVILGKSLTIVKKYLDLNKSYLWVVYPRNNGFNNLHLQIAGVWDPYLLQKELINNSAQKEKIDNQIKNVKSFEEKFSIRGLLIFSNTKKNQFIIKIKQKSFLKNKKFNNFKIYMNGEIDQKYLNSFIDITAKRNGLILDLENYEDIN